MGDWAFSQSEIIDMLVDVFGDSCASKAQVVARFKSWQFHGYLGADAKTGRGTRCTYDREMTWRAVLLAELNLMGFAREAAAKLLDRFKADVASATKEIYPLTLYPAADSRSSVRLNIPMLLLLILDRRRARHA